MDFTKSIKDIESIIGYVFRDKSLLQQAFTRSSYCNEKNYRGRENYSSNEVLEFFGDSVLSTSIITLLLRAKTERYEHGIKTELTEGDMSNIRSKLSDKSNLSRSTMNLGLQKYLLLGEGDEKLGISTEASVMEDLFESIIGAVYIDCGMDLETVIKVVSGMLDISVYTNGETHIQSYKNALQEWCADKKRRLPAPVYKTVLESGPDHRKTYERGCYIGDRLVAVGKGKNQKLADAQAAERAYLQLSSEEKERSLDQTKKDSEGAAQRLRVYAAKNKQPSPEYHDLGEAPQSTERTPIYRVECCFMGRSSTANGRSKQEARDLASLSILGDLSAPATKKEPHRPANQILTVAEKAKSRISALGISSVQSKAGKRGKLKINSAKQPAKNVAKAPDSKAKQENKKTDKSTSPKRTPLHHTKRS